MTALRWVRSYDVVIGADEAEDGARAGSHSRSMEILFAIVLRRTRTPRSKMIAKRMFCDIDGVEESTSSGDDGIVVPFFKS